MIEKVKSGNILTEEEEKEFFTNLQAEEIKEVLSVYNGNHPMSDQAELKLFDLPQEERKELLAAYIKRYGMCEQG